MSESRISSGKSRLIVCFGGMAKSMGGIPPFEFMRYLNSTFKETCDLAFYVDVEQCWYHKGLQGISNNIDETVVYLLKVIQTGNYSKVIFQGASAGGYAAILFGSLCHVSTVIAYIPQTQLINPIDKKYGNLKEFINPKVRYVLYGSTYIHNIEDLHHIHHCLNLTSFSNVEVKKKGMVSVQKLRDSGEILKLLEDALRE
jgi:hypothetical protein